MTFTQEFIDEALKEHHKWVDKVRYVSSEFDVPLTWRQVLISNESEILNLLNHLRVEIHDESSMYSELRYELEYTKDMITKMFLHAQIICTLIDILRKRVLSDVLITAIVISNVEPIIQLQEIVSPLETIISTSSRCVINLFIDLL